MSTEKYKMSEDDVRYFITLHRKEVKHKVKLLREHLAEIERCILTEHYVHASTVSAGQATTQMASLAVSCGILNTLSEDKS
jgi:hypothetical protein